MFKEMIDREAFIAIVENYGADYQGGSLNRKVVDEMLETHIRKKAHIFKLFGNKLKIEKEIETTVSRNEAHSILKNLLENELPDSRKLIFVKSFLARIDVKDFSSNILSREMKIFDVVLPKGMKVSKALSKLCLEEDCHEVITKHSMALQQMTTKGKMVISIDPCDYVTMSSNNSGWRSCHRLDGGEYRTGPLAYLRDSSSVICYLESSKPCTFRRYGKEFSHSNKVWRQIALVSPNLDFSIQERQYPNENAINANAVSGIFKELFETINKTSYKYKSVEVGELCCLHKDYANLHDSYRYFYNDVKNEMFDEGNVVFNSNSCISALKELALPIKGEKVFCLNCGEDVYESDSLYCEDCGDNDEW